MGIKKPIPPSVIIPTTGTPNLVLMSTGAGNGLKWGGAIPTTYSGGGSGSNASSIQGTPVSSTSPTTTNNLFVFNGTNWVPTAMSGDVTMTDLGVTTLGKIKTVPVTITSLTSGQALVYNGTAWVNSSVSASSLWLVLISGTAPSGANQTLITTDSTHASWQQAGVATYIADSSHAISISTLTSGQVLVWNGTYWVNSTANAASIDGVLVSGTPSVGQALVATSSTAADWQAISGTATSIGSTSYPVSLSSPFSGQALVWNGSDWVNSAVATNANLFTGNCSATSYSASSMTTVITVSVSGYSNYMIIASGVYSPTGGTGLASSQIQFGGSTVGIPIGAAGGASIPLTNTAISTGNGTGSHNVTLQCEGALGAGGTVNAVLTIIGF